LNSLSLLLSNHADHEEVKPKIVPNLLKLVVIKTNDDVDTRIMIRLSSHILEYLLPGVPPGSDVAHPLLKLDT